MWERALPAKGWLLATRRDTRDLSNGGINKVSGILPGGYKPPFRGQGPLPQGRLLQEPGGIPMRVVADIVNEAGAEGVGYDIAGHGYQVVFAA